MFYEYRESCTKNNPTVIELLSYFFLSLSVVTESNPRLPDGQERRLTACLPAGRFERTPAVAFV